MRTLRVTGVARCGDLLTCADTLTDAYKNRAQVGIDRGITVAMVNLDHVAIAIIVASLCHGHYAASCRVDRSTLTCGDINAEVAGPVIIARKAVCVSGPDKSTAYCATWAGTLAGSRCA